jgi:DNA-binding helix-hairpin-helix protein with protein kinase domain
MSQMLRNGQRLSTAVSGLPCEITSFIGGGGQGEVYSGKIGEQSVAIKWYFPLYLETDQGIKERLSVSIRNGAPNDRFLWPEELVAASDGDSFGYIMPLREPRFKGMSDLIYGRIDPSFRARITACWEVASSFLALHSRGLCYRDISLGNVFLDPLSGETRICDNDNVDVNRRPGVIGGTPEFMAPEIVRGQAMPSAQTDLFSLALLLFYILCMNHPLKGRKLLGIHVWDMPAHRKILGESPVFIFDPNDRSNAAVPASEDDLREAGGNALSYWPIYPAFLRRLFIQSFTAGLTDPEHSRVRETEWQAAMGRMIDSIIYCAACGKQNFYDRDALRVSQNPGSCWSCAKPLRLPPRLRIGRDTVVMLNHDSKIYPHHLGDGRTGFDNALGEVIRHPTNPGVWGLKNIGTAKWVASSQTNEMRDIEPGKSVALSVGTKVHFGKAEGQIHA